MIFFYIDPASTALLWQILAGVLITFGVVLGIWWTKISTFFKSLFVKVFRKNKKNDNKEVVIDEELEEIESIK